MVDKSIGNRKGNIMSEKVDKYCLSPLERAFENFTNRLVRFVPQRVSPNQITILAFTGSIISALSFYLAGNNSLWFLVAALGVFVHLVLDNIDGAVARNRKSTSSKGQFLDMLTDNIGLPLIFIGLGFSNYFSMKLCLFCIILWNLHVVVMMNSIILKNKWIFPYLSSFESHMALVVLSIISYIVGSVEFTIFNLDFGIFEGIIALLIIPSYFEVAWLIWKLYSELDGPEFDIGKFVPELIVDMDKIGSNEVSKMLKNWILSANTTSQDGKGELQTILNKIDYTHLEKLEEETRKRIEFVLKSC